MRRFDLLEPRSIDEAVDLLEQHPDARLIAGGTALLVIIKQRLYVPTVLVNLKKVQGASDITFDPELGLRIGALASIHDIETAEVVRRHYPLLAEACHVVANIRIRNLATVGGNLAHADYQSDPPAALTALGASVELVGPKGTREMPLSELLLDMYETALNPGEILAAVRVPPPRPGQRHSYIKFTTRSSEDRPCAAVAALVSMRDGTCEDVRLVVGAVSGTPVRVAAAERLAQGQRLGSDVLDAMAAEAANAVDPIDDLRGPAAYKRRVTGVLARRALASCMNGATA